MFLVRKVSQEKWRRQASLGEAEIGADALGEIRTTKNALSFWCAPTDSTSDLNAVALALAATGDRLDKMDLAWVDRSAAEGGGIKLETTPGDTCIADLRDRHVDAVNLDVHRLITLAGVIAGAVRQSAEGTARVRRLTRSEMLQILRDALVSGRLKAEDLKPSLRKEVEPK